MALFSELMYRDIASGMSLVHVENSESRRFQIKNIKGDSLGNTVYKKPSDNSELYYCLWESKVEVTFQLENYAGHAIDEITLTIEPGVVFWIWDADNLGASLRLYGAGVKKSEIKYSEGEAIAYAVVISGLRKKLLEEGVSENV